MTRLFCLVLLLGVLVGCSDDPETDADKPTPSAPTSTSPSATPATTAPAPKNQRCYNLTYDEALAPTSAKKSVSCRKRFTARTFHVAQVDNVVDGHLLAVDSAVVQGRIARECPRRLASYLGASAASLRLSMFQTVWFSPTLKGAEDGEDWYRCDVIALASSGKLAPMSGRLKGVLGSAAGRDRYGLCGTAEPGTKGFRRVICSQNDAWRAISTIDIKGKKYPSRSIRTAGENACEDAAREGASDALNFTWGYEWPTEKQWNAGQHHGFCWAPRTN